MFVVVCERCGTGDEPYPYGDVLGNSPYGFLSSVAAYDTREEAERAVETIREARRNGEGFFCEEPPTIIEKS